MDDLPENFNSVKELNEYFRLLPAEDKKRLGANFNRLKKSLSNKETLIKNKASEDRCTQNWIDAHPNKVHYWHYTQNRIRGSYYVEEILNVETPDNKLELLQIAASNFGLKVVDGMLIRSHGQKTLC